MADPYNGAGWWGRLPPPIKLNGKRFSSQFLQRSTILLIIYESSHHQGMTARQSGLTRQLTALSLPNAAHRKSKQLSKFSLSSQIRGT